MKRVYIALAVVAVSACIVWYMRKRATAKKQAVKVEMRRAVLVSRLERAGDSRPVAVPAAGAPVSATGPTLDEPRGAISRRGALQ